MTKSFEGTVENGRIKLSGGITLPDNTKVVVLVPEASDGAFRLRSPRLVDLQQVGDFEKEVIESDSDAAI